MMTTTAYPVTMTDLRGEPAHSSFWSTYNGSAHLANRLGTAAMDSGFHSSASASPLPGRPRSGHEQSYSYGRYSQEDSVAYDRHSQPTLPAQHNYPSLKRPFSQTEPAAYQEIVQDLRDDGSRLTVNQDHKLLAFRRTQDKHTIVDQQGRMQQLELSAQLHGMFFLSEMPSTASDGTALQPELTCYRRNLFQISGSLITPRGQLSVVNESNETLPVSSMEVAISAIESVDGNPVRLIVIPWKTPPPNAPEISQSPDQEPAALPLIPFQDDGSDPEGDYAVYPIGWRRLQFRIATANNGRRKELQQHFVLHLKVFGTLSDNSKVVLTESTTAPIVVRGRSPRNFQTRKEIPLLGSSAGSRGQALVETGLGVVAGALSVKPQELKRSADIQVPRSSFTFSPPKIPGSGQLSSMRSNQYSTWSASSSSTSISQVASSGPGGYPAATMGADTYSKVSIPSASSFASDPQELPLQSSVPSLPLSMGASEQQSSGRGQYTYVQQPASGSQLPASTPAVSGQDSALSIPRYVDNGRPNKSPRHSGQQSIHGASSANSESPEYRYGPSTQGSASSREYYPPSQAWSSTAAGENSSSAAYANADARPYSFPHEPYKAGTATASPVKAEPRGSFEPMHNYSWSAN
ncbi:ndt80 like dna-binding family [Trichoderma cornu-damae]|uniref:Ndt80 like dna-binding family n=1 Tax=Trichoderma cornu-damae TaxID=654480 RepID=A0A9P8QTE3_9HYPO|nr:ndt80 like dna-binding family [Trichoderma cornu-damae]